MTVSFTLGVGCRRSAAAADIAAIVDALIDGVSPRPARLHTLAEKVGDENLTAAAALLGMALVGFDRDRLSAQAARIASPSGAALRRFGVPSVAEASALAAAGAGAKIVATRRTREIVCALAEALA